MSRRLAAAQALLIGAALVVGPAGAAETPRPPAKPDLAGVAFSKPEPARAYGVLDVSVNRRLAGALTGSAGFLCGLKPDVGKSGAAASLGEDPHGQFVGAKLALRF